MAILPSLESLLQTYISAESRLLPNSVIEMEIRFRPYYSIDEWPADSPFAYGFRYHDVQRIKENITGEWSNPVTTYDWHTERNDKIRKRVTSYTDKIEDIHERLTKTRIGERQENPYPINVAISIETKELLGKPPAAVTRKRIKTRESLIIDSILRIDVTLVKSDRKTKYEVELEVLSRPDEVIYETLRHVTRQLMTILYDTTEVYTIQEYKNVVKSYNTLLWDKKQDKKQVSDERMVSKTLYDARNLHIDDMVYGGLIGNCKPMIYRVGLKADGIRKLIFVLNGVLYLLYPPYSVCRVAKTQDMFNISIIECDIIPRIRRIKRGSPAVEGQPRPPTQDVSDKTIWGIVHDCLYFRNEDVRTKTHNERMKSAQLLVDIYKDKEGIIYLETKYFTTLGLQDFNAPDLTGRNFFQLMREMFEEEKVSRYPTDGLIFVPNEMPYNSGNDKQPLRLRNLVHMADICKWKSSERLTTDFAIIREGTPAQEIIKLMCHDPNGGHIEYRDYKGRTMPQQFIEIDSDIESGSIVECTYLEGIVKSKALRPDKPFPNSLEVAQDNMKLAAHPILRSTLTGNNLILMRRYHNNIKRELLDFGGHDKWLLDLGSGKFGDYNKWKPYSKVIAVEPNYKYIEEALERAMSFRMNVEIGKDNAVIVARNSVELNEKINKNKFWRPRILILHTGAENTEFVSEGVELMTGNYVDVVSMMFSLSLMFPHIDKVVKTITENVDENGRIVFATIDGDLVRAGFTPPFAGLPRIDITFGNIGKLKYIPASVESVSTGTPVESDKLEIDISTPTVGSEGIPQVESLVDMDRLSLLLKKEGFNLVDHHRATKEQFLNPNEVILSSFYSYGYYSKKKPIPIEKKPVPTEIAEIVTKKKTVPTEIAEIPPRKKTVPTEIAEIVSKKKTVPTEIAEIVTKKKTVPIKTVTKKVATTEAAPTGKSKITLPTMEPVVGLLEDDRVVTVEGKIVVIGLIDDFYSSIFAGILKALDTVYANTSDRHVRNEIMAEFRRDMAIALNSGIEGVTGDKTIYAFAATQPTKPVTVLQKELNDLTIRVTNLKPILECIALVLDVQIIIVKKQNNILIEVVTIGKTTRVIVVLEKVEVGIRINYNLVGYKDISGAIQVLFDGTGIGSLRINPKPKV